MGREAFLGSRHKGRSEEFTESQRGAGGEGGGGGGVMLLSAE